MSTNLLSARETEFKDTYGPYIGKWRMEAIAASGKFICETAGDGVYVRDINRKSYLDCFLATGVFNLGHRNEQVGRALTNALETESYGGVFYLSEAKGELARLLVETTPKELELVLPCIGGGEAIDLALKVATGNTGRKKVICCHSSYHGSTGLAAELGSGFLRDWYPLEALEVVRVEPGDINSLRNVVDDSVAALVMEPIRSLFDGKKSDRAYWSAVRDLCDAKRVILIVDEVVCGMGRLGTLWGSEEIGISPDILVSAKGLSGGYFPMAAVVTRADLVNIWGNNPFRHYSTYAWSNVGARVAIAAIEETQRLLPQAMAAGDALHAGLKTLQAQFPDTIKRIQRTGMHFVVMTNFDRVTGKELTLSALANGLLLQASGAYPEAPAKIFPPLILEAKHVDEICDKLSDSLKQLESN
ncbi:aspartate aminotransferase family protein [Hoeflea sp.]|uniref:class-III pyridoxal-phosphate-dependent aminotransferase n=1 Tax=Hoeflea sp. TaxID=1940281 RepID=UPI003B028D3B